MLRRAAAPLSSRVSRSLLAPTRLSACASLVASVPRSGVTSLSKTRDGKPIYCNEHDEHDQSRFAFSKCIAVPKVAAIVGGQRSSRQASTHAGMESNCQADITAFESHR